MKCFYLTIGFFLIVGGFVNIKDLIEQLPNKRRSIKDLANYIKIKSGSSPNYSLFLGAGASVTSGINSGAQLVDEWRREVYEMLSGEEFDDVKKAKSYLIDKESSWYDPSNEYSSLFQKKFDLPSQRRRFVEKQVDSKLPSIGYSYMVSLFQSGYFDTVFTTNFDDLINEAFYQFSRERPTLCAHDSSIKSVSVNSSRPKIIKVHGDYLFDSIKSTLNETESLETNTREKLIEFTKKYGLIFIGYAGNDRSIIDVVNYLLRQDEFLGNGIYWCFRKDDEINPDLHKILKKERVYYIEIDGFDEALAEIHYHINGEGLSLEANFKSTKRESMIANFIEDTYQLSKNNYISQDIKRLQTHTNKLDISNLINELSGENFTNSTSFTENDFRNLLTLDNLVKHKKLDEAEKEALKLMSICSSDDLKLSFISRLINIYNQQENYEMAIEQADKALEIDEFSVNNNLRKLSLFKNPVQRMEFVNQLVEKIQFSPDIRNQYAREALKYRVSKQYKNDVKLDAILEKLKDSIKLNPSLENSAWHLTEKALSILKDEGDNHKDYKEKLQEIISKMCEMNPFHLNTLKMKMKLCLLDNEIDSMQDLLKELDQVYLTSSKKKKEELFLLMIKINRKLPSYKNRDASLQHAQQLFDLYSKEFDNSEEAIPTVFKAEYAVSFDRDLKYAKELIIRSLDLDGVCEQAQSVIDILTYEHVDEINALKFLEKCKIELELPSYLLLKCQVSLEMEDYDTAVQSLEKALVEGLDYKTYLINLSYAYLREGAYQKALNLIETGIKSISHSHDKNVLVINRELAKKSLGQKINKIDIQNVIGKDKKGAASVAAHILLDEEIPARRLLDEIVNNDFSYYYTFLKWPVIPKHYLDKHISGARVENKISA